ncbi:heme-binding protein [Limibaculum sp. FT325]|uniref:GlcG/HbpS family heme-binding protein n=1 Tax=Thermohalobaculum sediminis TaxID=2939436 RepID=UPI0020C11D6C|nr:heme-binding protein [Limibaculum sediminis]MCL5778654.1 heme-binding protein [Limibaculum sediminis]
MRRLLAATAIALAPLGAQAQDEGGAFVEVKLLKPELALELAVAAMESCRAGGYQVGVAVVDRFGVLQVFLRDRFAGPHVEEIAQRKAWTAVSFRTDTLALDHETRDGSLSAGIRDSARAIALGGGVPILAGDGALLGGVGVSGAPGPDIDDECARAGIAAIEDEIAF